MMVSSTERWRRKELSRQVGLKPGPKHPFGEADVDRRGPPYLFPYACFHCRSSFRRKGGDDDHVLPCVRCRAPSIRLSRKFKPPRRGDVEQWRKVEALVRAGFLFGGGDYPERLREVPAFIKQNAEWLARHQARWPELHVRIGAAFSAS
jgi:hypothetical protein